MSTIKYFTVNEDIEQTIQSIKKDIQLSMNGICAESLITSGINYKQTFGVSWQRLCDIAKKYVPNYELAERLWYMPIRETKMIATILCPPNELSPQRLTEWIEGITTVELAEIFSFSLLCKTNLYTEMLDLELSHNEFIRITAYHTIARQISKLSNAQIECSIKNIQCNDLNNISAFRAIESIAYNAINKSDQMRTLMLSFINKLKLNQYKYSNILADNIQEMLT